MFWNLIILSVILFSSLSSFAKGSTVGKLERHIPKRTPKTFGLEFLIASEQTRDAITTKTDGSYSKFDASLTQHLSKNDELRYFLSTRYIDTQQEGFGNEFEFFFSELMYRRKNLLTQFSHGVNLSAEMKGLRIIDPDIVDFYGYDWNMIPQLVFKKSWGRRFNVELKLRRHFYNTVNDDAYTLDNEDRVYLSASTFIGRSTMFFTQLKYQHKIRKGDGPDWRLATPDLIGFNPMTRQPDFSRIPEAKKNQELVTIHPSILHFLNRKNMVEFYVETKLSNTYDKRTLDQIAEDEFVVGTALYLTAF